MYRLRGLRPHRLEALALAGTSSVVGLIGARLLFVSMQGRPLEGFAWLAPWQPGLASFGLLLGAGSVVGIYVWHRDRDAGRQVVDAIVPPGFVALAGARLGCLANGCDFGAPTSGGWGLRYPAGTAVWKLHRELGYVGLESAWSAPTHPLPIYLVGGTLAVVLLCEVITASSSLPPGTEALGLTAGYLLIRGAAEAFRDPRIVTTSWTGGTFECTINQALAWGALTGLAVYSSAYMFRSSTPS